MEFSQLTDLGVKLLPVAAASSAGTSGTPAGGGDKLVVGSSQISGSRVLSGADGKPAVTAQVTMPRSTVQAASDALNRTSAAILAALLAFSLALGFSLDHFMLRRFTQLTTELDDVARNGNPGSRVKVGGKDEIGQLAREINSMLESMEWSEHELAFLAGHDPLTQLANRRRFEEVCSRELAEARRLGSVGSVLWLDLDHFKYINDGYGHAAGDEALVQFAEFLRHHARSYSTLARLGGDEFAVLLPHAEASEALGASKRLVADLAATSFAVEGRSARIGVSIGVVTYPRDGDSLEDLLAAADLAMYVAKDAGRGRVSVYSLLDDPHRALARRMEGAEAIAKALKEDRFELYAMPIVHVSDGRRGLFELLLRMVDEDGKIVPADEIIPIAESLGLIRDIDHWVVRRAVSMLAAERDAGRETAYCINLSGHAIADPEILEMLRDEIVEHRVDPSRLVIEMSEGAAIADIEGAREFIDGLREIGCRFSLDDFGSGSSSFFYLRHLSIDYLKIDGSLVRNLARIESDRYFVRAIIEMCKGLHIETVAEFVENEDLLRIVNEQGADFVQGYELGEPEPVEKPVRDHLESAAS